MKNEIKLEEKWKGERIEEDYRKEKGSEDV